MDNKDTQSANSNSSSNNETSPKELVDDLEITWNTKIKGKLRKVLEKIAERNLKKKCPIIKDIFVKGVSYDTKKKIFTRAKKRNLIVIHPKKFSHSNRYALSNMQDFEVHTKPEKKIKHAQEIMNVNEILLGSTFCMDAVREMLHRTSIEFHHIVITTTLQCKDDYEYFNWYIPSQKNKAKVRDFPLSRYRGCKVTLYPNGRTIVVIYSSKYPFNLFSYEGLVEFNVACGQIYEHIVKYLRLNVLFTSEPLDWSVMQIDGAYDIKVVDLQRALDRLINRKIKVENGGYISFRFPSGYLRIKYLHQLFQIYTKRLPYKGECLRIENRLSFKQPHPTVRDIVYNYSDRNKFGGKGSSE